MQFIIINKGSDAGGWYIDANGHIHRIPGWEPEMMLEVSRALEVIQLAAQFKTRGLAEAVTSQLTQFVQKSLPEEAMKGGGPVVIVH